MYAAIMTSTLVDVTGLKVTCKSEEAVQYYNEAVQLFVGRLANYLPAVEKSLEIDPDFVMAKCFQVSCTEQKIGDARVFIFYAPIIGVVLLRFSSVHTL